MRMRFTGRRRGAGRPAAASSSVAIGTALVFVLVASVVGAALDTRPAGVAIGADWRLRGSINSLLKAPSGSVHA